MSNALIAARDAFAARRPESTVMLNGRGWGVIDTGRDEGGKDEGGTLLLIPGTLGRADIFWQQIEALEGRLRLIAVSYPAGGALGDWTDDLIALLDARGVGRAAVLGTSLGGYLAQALAGAPGMETRVTHLFAANTLASAAGLDARPPYSLDLDAAPIADLREGFAAGLRRWVEANPDQDDLVELLLQEVGGRIPEPELRQRLKALKSAPELPRCPLPPERTTVIEAADDPLIPEPMRRAVRERLRPGTVWRFRWGGHFPYVVRPGDYTALLERALGMRPADPGGPGLREI